MYTIITIGSPQSQEWVGHSTNAALIHTHKHKIIHKRSGAIKVDPGF